VTRSRLRNLLLPVALAVLAVALIGAYVVSYRNSVNEGAELVKVMVAAKDIPAGTSGSAVASGGYLKTETVPRRALVPGSVVSAAPLTSMVAKDPVYQGQQVTLRQFGPISQGGIFAKFSGKQSSGNRPIYSPAPSPTVTTSTSSPLPRTRTRASPGRRRASCCATCSFSRRPTPAKRSMSATVRTLTSRS
jgi:hypothetical protein